jgi:hypothetical protein
MAANAVPRPMGQFVVQAVSASAPSDGLRTSFGVFSDSGLYEGGIPWSITHADGALASNLGDFLDPTSADNLSSQAAAGLLVRSVRSQQPMPRELFELLKELADQRNGSLRPSRANSFQSLETMATGELERYRSGLSSIADYINPTDEQIESSSS